MHYLNARQTLRRLLEWRVVPVVNENDTTATDEITFGDNDFLSAQVAILLDARLLVLLTDTDGLYTADPRSRPGGRSLVERSTTSPSSTRYEIGDRTSPFGSGGMRSKVAAAEMASAAGIPAAICDGTAAGTLLAAARGRRRRHQVRAAPGAHSSFKLWLRYAKPARGRVVVDDGAARVLRESGSSLLPVGIVAVEGEFAAGDAVEVVCDGARGRQGDRQLLGRGARADHGDEERRRCASCFRTPPRRPSTGIASCWPETSAVAPAPRQGRCPRLGHGPVDAATLVSMAIATRTVAEACESAKRACARAGERLDRGQERAPWRRLARAARRAHRARSSRRTRPTSPTSAPRGSPTRCATGWR